MHPQLRFWRPLFCLLNYTPMAGVKRFALLNVGIKIRCLTAWLNPNVLLVFPSRQRYFVFLRCVFVRGTPQLPLFGFLFSLARNIYCRVYPVKPHGETASVPQTFRSTRSSPYRGDYLLRKVFKSAVYCSTIYHSSLTSRKVTYLYLP